MSIQRTPPRLLVFLASQAPVGVILRRGPTRWAQLTLWRTDTDTFHHGQWIKARIYEDRADLAPDGSLFVYFAHQGRAYAHGGFAAWTAVSRPPYFTALGFWPQAGTYFGGGMFETPRSVLLHGRCTGLDSDWRPEHLTVAGLRGQFAEGWCYMQRLARDGWLVERPSPPPARKWWSVAKPPSVWRRPHPGGAPTLVMSYPGSPEPSLARIVGDASGLPAEAGGYGVRFWLESDDHARTLLEDATWADWDQRGRLVLTKAGRLFATEITPTAIGPLPRAGGLHRATAEPAALAGVGSQLGRASGTRGRRLRSGPGTATEQGCPPCPSGHQGQIPQTDRRSGTSAH